MHLSIYELRDPPEGTFEVGYGTMSGVDSAAISMTLFNATADPRANANSATRSGSAEVDADDGARGVVGFLAVNSGAAPVDEPTAMQQASGVGLFGSLFEPTEDLELNLTGETGWIFISLALE